MQGIACVIVAATRQILCSVVGIPQIQLVTAAIQRPPSPSRVLRCSVRLSQPAAAHPPLLRAATSPALSPFQQRRLTLQPSVPLCARLPSPILLPILKIHFRQQPRLASALVQAFSAEH